jgi:hypothetical protein
MYQQMKESISVEKMFTPLEEIDSDRPPKLSLCYKAKGD